MQTENHMDTQWISCPGCGGNTRTKIRKDTELIHHLIFCPKCKNEYLVNVKKFHVNVIKEED